jgi:hypothetical protein
VGCRFDTPTAPSPLPTKWRVTWPCADQTFAAAGTVSGSETNGGKSIVRQSTPGRPPTCIDSAAVTRMNRFSVLSDAWLASPSASRLKVRRREQVDSGSVDAGSTLAGSHAELHPCVDAGRLLPPTVGIGPGGLTDGGRITSPAFAVNRCRDHGASQTTMCDFIPLRNKLISLGAHKISVLLVIDPTNDPVSRRYDQADILGIRHLSCPPRCWRGVQP